MPAQPDVLKISFRGLPVAKGRPRAMGRVINTDHGPRAAVRLLTPDQTRRAEKRIRAEFRDKYPNWIPWTGPVMLQFTAVFPLLKGFSSAQRHAALEGSLYHTSRPDKDNIEKLICDALNGLAWIDDAQVQGGGVKRYGEAERIDVTLRRISHIGTPADARRESVLAQPMLAAELARRCKVTGNE